MLLTGCYGNMLMRTGPYHIIFLNVFLWEHVSVADSDGALLDTQLIGLGENNFENGHESGGLAEVARAHYVGMDGQSF